MLFIDPHQLSFAEWQRALRPGYRFDYEEGRFRVTVEVAAMRSGSVVELDLRIVDTSHSQPGRPERVGDTFCASYAAGESPMYVWTFRPAGAFARYAEWQANEEGR